MQLMLSIFLCLFSTSIFAAAAGIKNYEIEVGRPQIFSNILDFAEDGLYLDEEIQKIEPLVDLNKTKLLGVELLAKSNGSLSYVYLDSESGQTARRHLKGNFSQYASDYDYYHDYYIQPVDKTGGSWFLGFDGVAKVLKVKLIVDLYRKDIIIDPIQPIIVKVPLTNYSSLVHDDLYTSTLTFAPYQYELSSFLGYASKFQEEGTIPLYGCKYGNDRYATTKSDCGGGGSTLVKILGYIFKDRVSKSIPIYACRSYLGDFFTTTSENCEGVGKNGGTFGYILP